MLFFVLYLVNLFLVNVESHDFDWRLQDLIRSLETELDNLDAEIKLTEEAFNLKRTQINLRVHNTNLTIEERFNALLEWNGLNTQISISKMEYDLDRVCFRYRKGIEVLKMIYEKVLSLDHHFSSMVSYQEISMMSNPNSYPEFVKFKADIKSNTKAKNKVQIPQLLDNNPIFSMGYTLFYSFFGTSNKAKRIKQLEDISCLLDFSLSMNSDLKIIYYETDYLKVQNSDLKKSSQDLFDSYTKLMKYKFGLEYCRAEDDWDALFTNLEKLRIEIKSKIKDFRMGIVKEPSELSQLKFSIDQLMDFMDSYTHFIYLGEMYYHKFLSIVKSYENAEPCIGFLPKQFELLSEEIVYSISKFESAYKIAELRGSKLRDLMYGVPDN